MLPIWPTARHVPLHASTRPGSGNSGRRAGGGTAAYDPRKPQARPRYWANASTQTFVKRCIGVPGDHIRLVNKRLYLNGHAVDEPYVFHKSGIVDSYRDNFPGVPNTYLSGTAPARFTIEGHKLVYSFIPAEETNEFSVKVDVGGQASGSVSGKPVKSVRGWVRFGRSSPSYWNESFDPKGPGQWMAPPP